jgi:cellulose synthase/poly-beta-1,6-N-acetylglucosamine synthase-like glycosyltransferase
MAAPNIGASDRSPWVLVTLAGATLCALAVLGIQLLVTVVAFAVQATFLLYFVRHLLFSVSAMQEASQRANLVTTDRAFRPRVSVLVACKDEVAVIDGLVQSLLRLDYPADLLQIVIVDDGSSDGTGMVLDRLATVHPQLTCLHREANGGKPAALNSGLGLVTGEIVVVFDADHRPHRDVLRRLVRHFQDPSVGAVQGRCVISNAEETPVTRLVAVDYLAGYLVNEHGRQAVVQLPAYGGANCAVRSRDLWAVGGWNPASVTEDTDLTLRLVLAGRRVRYDVTAIDEEEAVINISRYWKQRYRWARGHQKVWRDYRRAVWSSGHMSLAEKVETTMFLLAFHVPVASGVGLVVLFAAMVGLATPRQLFDTSALWTLLFIGPLLELGGALLVARTPRREALALVWFLPLFMVSIALCTKAWFDGLLGRSYLWVKTERTQATMAVTPGPVGGALR